MLLVFDYIFFTEIIIFIFGFICPGRSVVQLCFIYRKTTIKNKYQTELVKKYFFTNTSKIFE
jgi:positive regulator of sigma E activity